MKKLVLVVAALAAAFTAGPAAAATIVVDFTGTLNQGLGNYMAHVTLDVINGQAQSGIGSINILGKTRGLGLITTKTTGNIDASATYPGYPVGFRSNNGDDLFGADTAFPLTTPGGLLFAIGTTTPVFGQNALLNFYNADGPLTALVYGTIDDVRAYGATGTLDVSIEPEAAVPEPATWAMMLLGFGMIGLGMRARRKSKVATRVNFV